jgi:C4-type Zn-finger protein
MSEEIKKIFEKADEMGLKVVFGLEAQGHIPTIEAIIEEKQKSMDEHFPDEDINVIYAKYVWEEIGKKIGWCSFSACLKYFEYLENKNGKV